MLKIFQYTGKPSPVPKKLIGPAHHHHPTTTHHHYPTTPPPPHDKKKKLIGPKGQECQDPIGNWLFSLQFDVINSSGISQPSPFFGLWCVLIATIFPSQLLNNFSAEPFWRVRRRKCLHLSDRSGITVEGKGTGISKDRPLMLIFSGLGHQNNVSGWSCYWSLGLGSRFVFSI